MKYQVSFTGVLDVRPIWAPPSAPRLRVFYIRENHMSSNLVTITPPTTRTDNTPLALTDIASITLSKAVDAGPSSQIQVFTAPITGPVTFTDTSPDMGSTDNYSATVTDTQGNVGPAGTASVQVPPSQLAPPSAPTVTAAFQP
jgi:hypothetical protein